MSTQAPSQSLFYTSIESPIGELLLLGDGRTLHGLYMQGRPQAHEDRIAVGALGYILQRRGDAAAGVLRC